MEESYYQHIIEQIENIIINKGYTIGVVEADEDNSHLRINIMNDYEEAATLRIIKTTGTVLIGPATRTAMEQMFDRDTDVFSVEWLSVNPKYRGQSLGTLLLIYGMYYIKTIFNDIEFVILDDDSDKSTLMGENIYNAVGFRSRERVSLNIGLSKQVDKGNKIILGGPEKQFSFNDNESKRKIELYILELNALIRGVLKKYKNTKRKKRRQSKKKRKTKRKYRNKI